MFIDNGFKRIGQAPQERNIFRVSHISLLRSEGRWVGSCYKHPAPMELSRRDSGSFPATWQHCDLSNTLTERYRPTGTWHHEEVY